MKVGKAIYNILSQSTDVQSNFPFNTTDYAPTGTELVTNGDFSAAGINLVTNPNFTDTGADLVVDGDFPLPNVNWVIQGTSTINGGSATVEGLGNITGSHLYRGVSQLISISVGTSYKITFTAKQLTGSGAMYSGLGYSQPFNQVITSDYVEYTFYQVPSNVTGQWSYVGFGGAVGNTFEIKDVSVKELGASWTLGTGWSIGDSEAVSDGTNSQITQSVMTAEKSYKITVTVTGDPYRLVFTGSSFYNSLAERTLLNGTHTYYLQAESSVFSITNTGEGGDACTLSNISVQELGEGWTLGTGWSIGEDKAICDGSTNNAISQALSLPVGNIKVTFKVEDFTSGDLNLWLNLPTFTNPLQADANGDYEVYVTTTSGANNLYFYSVAFIGSISNVSVQEMILTKIFPELAPPDIDAPYIVYSVVSNSPSDTKNSNGDIDTANIEVYGFQDTYNKAVDLGVSVRAALDRKTGTYNTIEIQSTNYVNEQMDVNEARKLWAAIQDYSIRIKNI